MRAATAGEFHRASTVCARQTITLDEPIAHRDHPVGVAGNLRIVRHQDQRCPFFPVQRQQQVQHVPAVCAVQIAGRSSAIRMGGRVINARASATRCCSPPESCTG